jgi:hypothetical protein
MEYNNKYLEINNQIGGWTVQNYIQGTNYINIMGMPRNTNLEHLKLFLIDRSFRFDDITQNHNNFTIYFSSPYVAYNSRYDLIKVLAGKQLGLPAYNPNYVKPHIRLPINTESRSPPAVPVSHASSHSPPPSPDSYAPSASPVSHASSHSPKEHLVPSSDKITTVENGLREFGLKKFRLVDNDSIDNYFEEIIKDLDNLSDYIDEFTQYTNIYTLKHKGLYGSYYEKNYIVGSSAGTGSWNETFTCKDEKGKEFIIKRTNTPDMDGERESFYENMKHLILYILIRKYIGKLKFIPQIYHLGILRKSKNDISIICIMEKGNFILGDYINTVPFIDTQKVFLKIYNSLFIIEDKLKMNFKHNDFKENNILVSSDGKPLLIDFGFCEFKIDTISFHTLTHKSHENFDSTNYFGYNIIHDIIQLLTSLYNIPGARFCPYDIFKFVKNRNTNILDVAVLIQYLNSKFPVVYTDSDGRFNKSVKFSSPIHLLPDLELQYFKKMFLTFYDKGKYDLVNDQVINYLLLGKSIFITPTELAYNIGIPLPSDDDSFGNFEEKYKKYKMKYLKLKNRLF